MPSPKDTVLAFIDALNRAAPIEEIGAFLAEDILYEELPNRLFDQGARRDRAAMLDGALRGRSLLSAQRFEVHGVLAEGDAVALELSWTGTLAVPLGSLPAGSTLRTRSGMFFTVRGGRIVHQRNYDCYDPFPRP